MNTEQLLAAIDEVRHDVDAWDYNITTRVYTVRTGPFTCTVKPIGLGWWYEVKHKEAGHLTTASVDTANEGRRLALDYATLYLQANVNA
jgi:hypothetical protein